MLMMILFYYLFTFTIMTKMKTYFLSFLINLEFLTITLLYYLIYTSMNNVYFFMAYLVLNVCDAILGMSLLVTMKFNFNHQNISMINLCL